MLELTIDNSLTFVTPDIGWKDYKLGIIKRAHRDKTYTLLIDPDKYSPPLLRVSKFAHDPFFYEQAEYTVCLIGILTNWSIFTDKDNTESSHHRRIYPPNIHMLHYIDKNLVQPGGKIQLEEGGLIRVCLIRKQANYNLEKILKQHELVNRSRSRIDGVLTLTPIPHLEIWDKLQNILRKSGITKRNELQSLYETWMGISQGYPPGYKSRQLDFDNAAHRLQMDEEELEDFLSKHLLKIRHKMHDLSGEFKRNKASIKHLIQCAAPGLGRPMSVIQGMERLNFSSCYRCQNNRQITVSSPTKNKSRCSKLSPLGCDVIVNKRNEFLGSVRKKIQKRDGQSCLICRAIGDSGSRKYEVGHILSACYTTSSLDERDGFMICHIHNGSGGMHDSDLVTYYPEAIKLAQKINLRVKT